MAGFEYMGVLGKEPAEALRVAGFVERGTVPRHSHRGDTGARLPSGWFLIVGESAWTKTAQELSAGCQAIYLEASDTAMSSMAILWEDGRQVWKVLREGDPSAPHEVMTEGDPPPEFHTIYAQLLEKQRAADAEGEEVDYLYNVPVDLATAITGYFELDPEPEGAVFTRLERVERKPEPAPPQAAPVPPAPAPAPPARDRPWWKFW